MGKREEQTKTMSKANKRLGGKDRSKKKATAKPAKTSAPFSLTGGLNLRANDWEIQPSSTGISFYRSTAVFKGGKF
jgi:hypothetical protein